MPGGFPWPDVGTYGFAVVVAGVMLTQGFRVMRDMEQTQRDATKGITEALTALTEAIVSFQTEMRATLAEIRRVSEQNNRRR